ncbi:MAG: efflux transporter outer membrane subunit [Deltaproteobacteria bacterium]|nr:efflux transporter outer membrane subunit [Deltaproteobacteria bacterium]
MKFSHKTTFVSSISWLPVGIAIVILTGCASVGPNYSPPKASVSTDWHTQLKGGLTAQEMNQQTLSAWWTTLNDPVLSRLIDRAVSGNLDLKKAEARIREARARRGIATDARFPTLDASGSVVRTRSSEETGTGKTSNLYAVGIDAGWELDIFGGVRRSVEAVEADLGASQEGLRDVLVSLLAEVALNYIEVRTYQARLTVAEANLAAQNETYQLTDELAVEQARYNLENTRSQIPTLRTGSEQGMNRIAVLLGEQPGTVHTDLERYIPIPVIPLKVAVGVPADVLRRRPDVRRAERELAAQTARIGVATADLYPKFKLSGSIGLEAFSSGNLVSSDSRTLSGGPSVTWRIFDAGAIRQNIEVQSALQEQYLIAYEAALLSALKEVENAIVAYAEEQNRRQSLIETTRAAQRAGDLAQHKYQAGLADFNNVLDAQRSLLSFQDQLAQSDGTVTSNLVRLYKALGGGWTSLAQNEKK